MPSSQRSSGPENFVDFFEGNTVRASHEHHHARLKAASRNVVTHAGTAAQLSAVTRVSESQINKYVGQPYPDFMPLDVVLDAELAAGAPIITQTLAAIQGYRLVPIDGPVNAPISARDAVSMVKGATDAAGVIFAATEDNFVDEGEKREIERKLISLVLNLQDVLMRVRSAREYAV
jgi:hypothetical protein